MPSLDYTEDGSTDTPPLEGDGDGLLPTDGGIMELETRVPGQEWNTLHERLFAIGERAEEEEGAEEEEEEEGVYEGGVLQVRAKVCP